MSKLTFSSTISSEVKSGDPEHDPNGEKIQTHELPSGELLVTFSPEFLAEMDWQVGDTLVWEFGDEIPGGCVITCPEAQARRTEAHG